jgi:serine/threonine protein kinase
MFFFYFIVIIVRIFTRRGDSEVYKVQHKETKKFFILKGSSTAPVAGESADLNSTEGTSKKKKEIEEKKKKFENLIVAWKTAMAKSEYIVKYINHWYDDVQEYSYILMEYCEGGDLGQEIQKRIEEKKQFTQQVCLVLFIIKRDIETTGGVQIRSGDYISDVSSA